MIKFFGLLLLVHYGHCILPTDVQDLVRGIANTLKGGGVDVLNQTIRLKKLMPGQRDVEEVDCVETMFMSPFHLPVIFAANGSVSNRIDPVCKWNFVGTAPCIPKLTCTEFDLDCDDEYLEVFDGYKGLKKYCGKEGPVNIVASSDLRDLYLEFKAGRKVKDETVVRFNCTVSCSDGGQGNPLPQTFEEKMNHKCFCGGKPNDDKIVGGTDAIKNEFPWLVALVEARTRQPFCGASIINDRMILTAGHCFKGRFMDINNLEVLVNAHVLDSTPNNIVVNGSKPLPKKYSDEQLAELDKGNGTRRYIPEEAHVHPLYVSETNDFDVAVIKLSTSIDFGNKLAHPICLPELGSYLRTFGRRKATIAGWGLPGIETTGTPTVLQKIDVNVFLPSECKELYAHRVNRRMLCAGYKAGGMDSCAGDSGGPLVSEDRKQVWYQIGSVSWGDGCAKEANPGVYFRTTESGQWLHYQSNKHDALWCDVPE